MRYVCFTFAYIQQIEIVQYWTFLGKLGWRLLSREFEYRTRVTGIMIEELLIALHLKRRSNPKVEVEEDSDASYSLKHTTLMRFHTLSSNFKLHASAMKAVFFTEPRCVRTSRDLFVYLSKVVVSSCHPSTFVYFCPIFYPWFIMEDVDLP